MKKRVTVLMGGWSSEREVSLVSGRAVAAALTEAGYEARAVDLQRGPRALAEALDPLPDVVFNALHGRYGEDGCVQGALELVGIPYTHSGVAASAVAMNKPLAKVLFERAGIACAPHATATREALLAGRVMDPPYVVKPINEGSSVGVHIVLDDSDETRFRRDIRSGKAEGVSDIELMVERYVAGREITVAVMGDRALGVTEIRPKEGFYDYRAKYTAGVADHLVPAPLPEAAYSEAMDFALRGHRALGCRGVTRSDMRYDDSAGEPGRVVMLEVNTQPGMTPVSLVPELAAYAGIGFAELVSWMVEDARCDG